jgi:hypothetical protein
MAGEVRGGDPHRQRQAGAQPCQLGGGLGLGGDPLVANHPRQQADRLLRAEHLQRQPARALHRHQPGEPVAAGHHDQATGAAGQQRADVLGTADVVQHHQHPPVSQQRPVQPSGLLGLHRDLGRRHPQPAQQRRQRLDRAQRRAGRIPLQVDVQLPVGEPLADPVRPVDGQRGLAHPGGAGDRRDRHRGRLAIPGARQQGVQLLQVVGAAGEIGEVHRQLAGRHGAGHQVLGRRGRGCPSRGRGERRARQPGQAQRVGQQAQRCAARPADPAGLQSADGADAQAGTCRQLLLREQRLFPQGAQ